MSAWENAAMYARAFGAMKGKCYGIKSSADQAMKALNQGDVELARYWLKDAIEISAAANQFDANTCAQVEAA